MRGSYPFIEKVEPLKRSRKPLAARSMRANRESTSSDTQESCPTRYGPIFLLALIVAVGTVDAMLDSPAAALLAAAALVTMVCCIKKEGAHD